MATGYPVSLAVDATSNVPLVHHLLQVDRGISFDRAMQILDAKAASNPEGRLLRDEGFWRSRRAMQGREKEDLKGHAILIQKPVSAFALNPIPVYKVYRPGTGLGQNTSLRDFTEGGR